MINADYGALAKQNELLRERIRRLEKKSIGIVRCQDCVYYTRSFLKQDGTPDMRYNKDWCSLHARLHEKNYYCADGMERDD